MKNLNNGGSDYNIININNNNNNNNGRKKKAAAYIWIPRHSTTNKSTTISGWIWNNNKTPEEAAAVATAGTAGTAGNSIRFRRHLVLDRYDRYSNVKRMLQMASDQLAAR